MLEQLKHRMEEDGVSHMEVADAIGASETVLGMKFRESVPVTLDEARAIRDRFFPGASLDDLFQSDGDVPTKSESLHAQVDAMGDAMRHATSEGDPEVAEIEGLFHECVNEWERQSGERGKH